jgi:hypothetical protein
MALARPDLLAPYLKLDQGGKIQAECKLAPVWALSCCCYRFFSNHHHTNHVADVWIDGDNGLRSKTTVGILTAVGSGVST